MSWISNIAKSVETAFETVRPAFKSIPPLLLICEIYKRPGLSAISLASAIIRRLPEAGIETGVNADGSPNKIGSFVRIFCEEMVKELKDNAFVKCAIPPGAITITGTGANAGGPVTIVGSNSLIAAINGILG